MADAIREVIANGDGMERLEYHACKYPLNKNQAQFVGEDTFAYLVKSSAGNFTRRLLFAEWTG